MKPRPIITPLILLHILLPSLYAQEEEVPQLSPEESVRQSSLTLGYQEGVRTAQQQMREDDFNSQAYLEGFLLGLRGEKLPLTPEEVRKAMSRLQENLTERETQTAQENLEAAKQFLSTNENNEGIIKTESGLQYRVIKAGEGEALGSDGLLNKDLFVKFRGTLPDGTQFSASHKLNPAQIHPDEVISGFREALSLMRVGGKWLVFVPPELAYGDQRRSSSIGPNQLLIFEIELVEARDKSPAPE